MSFMAPWAAPIGPHNLWAFRILTAIPLLLIVFWATKDFQLVTEVIEVVRAAPWKIIGMIVLAALMSFQLWLFMWAPLTGHALGVALGYFLLPLVLVVQSRLMYKDQLRWWHWLAVGLAAVGVILKVYLAGEVGWETFAVAFGFAPYFALRRWMGTESIGGMFWEQVIAAPVAVAVIGVTAVTTDVFVDHLPMIPIAIGITAWGALSMVLYILASRLMPLSVFGLLTYLEPALLTLVALLIGEKIRPAEMPSFLLIWAAVVLVFIGGTIQVIRHRRAVKGQAYSPAPATGSIPIQQNPNTPHSP